MVPAIETDAGSVQESTPGLALSAFCLCLYVSVFHRHDVDDTYDKKRRIYLPVITLIEIAAVIVKNCDLDD